MQCNAPGKFITWSCLKADMAEIAQFFTRRLNLLSIWEREYLWGFFPQKNSQKSEARKWPVKLSSSVTAHLLITLLYTHFVLILPMLGLQCCSLPHKFLKCLWGFMGQIHSSCWFQWLWPSLCRVSTASGVHSFPWAPLAKLPVHFPFLATTTPRHQHPSRSCLSCTAFWVLATNHKLL